MEWRGRQHDDNFSFYDLRSKFRDLKMAVAVASPQLATDDENKVKGRKKGNASGPFGAGPPYLTLPCQYTRS